MKAIHEPRTDNFLVLQIQINIKQLLYKVSLDHISAHKGVLVNDRTDQLAKQATTDNTVAQHIPIPHSFIRKILIPRILSEWQEYLDTSENGRHTYDIIPKLCYNLLTQNTTIFLTVHGPFNNYLHKFKRASLTRCECGKHWASSHSFLYCTLTQRWHIIRQCSLSKIWLSNIIPRATLLTKL